MQNQPLDQHQGAAPACVVSAALHNEVAKDLIRGQDLLSLVNVFGDVDQIVSDPIAKRLLHIVEVGAQIIHTERESQA